MSAARAMPNAAVMRLAAICRETDDEALADCRQQMPITGAQWVKLVRDIREVLGEAKSVRRAVRGRALKLPALKVAFREGFDMGMRECCGREHPASLVDDCWEEFMRVLAAQNEGA